MIDIEVYISQLTQRLVGRFGPRLCYVGLQGSYLRGEAHDGSDIDIMVVIDALSAVDLRAYRGIVKSLPDAERSCGFICGKADLANWNPLEICHLKHSTKDYYGVLSDLCPGYTETDVRNFVKMSINNLYHAICHSAIHSPSGSTLEGLTEAYKGVFFILQDLHCLRTGDFVATKAALLGELAGMDRAVLQRSVELVNGQASDVAEAFELLFTWCQETLASL